MPLVTIREYARLRGISHQAVRKAIDSGRLINSVVKSQGASKIQLIDSDLADKEWVPGTQEAMATQGTAGPKAGKEDNKVSASYAAARALRENYAARIAKLEFEIKSGKYVDAEEVRQSWLNVSAIARTKISGIPSKAKQRITEMTVEQVQVLEEIVAEVLTEIAETDPSSEEHEEV